MRARLLLAALVPVLACAHAEPSAVPELALAGVESEVAAALEEARAEVLREPDSSQAWGRFGDHCFVHHFLSQAAACYARAEELDPTSFRWSFRHGLCLLKEQPESALAPLERALHELESYAPAQRVYAEALFRAGRSDEALVHYARAAELDPKDPEAETAIGQIHLVRGEFELARQHLEAALARDNRHVEAHTALAQVCTALGQDKKAQRHAELARSVPPRQSSWDAIATPNLPPLGARNRTRLAQQLEQGGDLPQAEEQYRAALRSNPDYYMARSRLTRLLAAQGRRDEAIELLREAERANPAFEEVRKDLAKLLRAEPLAPAPEGDE